MSKSSSGKNEVKQQPSINTCKRKAMNSKEFLDGLAVKSAVKRAGKETKSIVNTDEQLASKPTARKTCKEAKSIDEQSTSKPAAKRTQKEAKSIDIDEQSASKPAAKQTRKEAMSIDIDEQSASKPVAKQTRKEAKSIDIDEQPASNPIAKKTCKVLNKKEMQGLCGFLNALDISVLIYAARIKLNEQPLPESLKNFVDKLFKNEHLLQGILLHHRERFVELFAECQKGVNSFLRFQLQWHHHCSAFLLSKEYLMQKHLRCKKAAAK